MAKYTKKYIKWKIELCEGLRDNASSPEQAAAYDEYVQIWIGRLSKTAQKELEKEAAKAREEEEAEMERIAAEKARLIEAQRQKEVAAAEREARERRERIDAEKKLALTKQIEALKALLPEEEKEVEIIKDLIEEAEDESEDELSNTESEDATNN